MSLAEIQEAGPLGGVRGNAPALPHVQAIAMMPVPWLGCMLAVSQLYHLPPRVLPSIQVVEAGQPGTISRNFNGTGDLGVMQVNTFWIPRLSRSWNMTPHVVAGRLIEDPCFNIAAAGAIMRIYLDESRGDVVQAVGYYHSHTPGLATGYQIKVIRAAYRLFGRPRPVRVPAKARTRLARVGASR
jgi:transglycosylase-like protein with SLT domain